jgi:hypothetical protein
VKLWARGYNTMLTMCAAATLAMRRYLEARAVAEMFSR